MLILILFGIIIILLSKFVKINNSDSKIIKEGREIIHDENSPKLDYNDDDDDETPKLQYISIGLTYKQMMNYLDNFIPEKNITITDIGNNLYNFNGGINYDLLALDMVGTKHNLCEVSLTFSVSGNLIITTRHTAILSRFLINALPEIGEQKAINFSTEFINKILSSLEITRKDFKTENIVGLKKINTIWSINNMMFIIIIKHKNAD